jgi:hypothetical protein
MNRYVDLHLHSTCSDGLYSPEEVVRMAQGAGLSAVALADHDNIDGIDAAIAAGAACGIEVISGVELSVVHGRYDDIHLLGYGFDHHAPHLVESLAFFRDFRFRRNELIVERVNEKLSGEGRPLIDLEVVRAKAGGTVGRPHIAMALIELGLVADSEEAFNRYLIPCNVQKRLFPIAEAIELVHRAGGVAVLAHPPFITPSRKVLTELVDTFVTLGLDGIEAWNCGADNNTVDQTITLARRRGLIVTGGTDFHGIDNEQLRFGGLRGNLRIPYACVEEIRTRCAERAGKQAPCSH